MPSPPPDVSREQIAELRGQHIGRLFLRAHRAYSERAVERLHARGHTGLTLAHTALLANLDTDGTRVTALARRAGMTKQSMGQLAVDLERRGYIARAADPDDGRATLVTFTERGWRFLRDAYDLKREAEAEYAAILGAGRMAQMRDALAALLDHIDAAKADNDGDENR